MSTANLEAGAAHSLSTVLSDAYLNKIPVAVPDDLAPRDGEAAYAVQREFLEKIADTAGGWKIGAKSPDGPIQGSPLPRTGIHHGDVVLSRKHFHILGLELEIAFTFSRDFSAGENVPADEAIMDSIQSMRASIEIVSSRLAGWPEAPPLTKMADLQNHGALIVGEAVPYRDDFSFLNPSMDFSVGATKIFNGRGNNPAGDPRRLLPWLVRHCLSHGLSLPAGSIVTTGSFTGIHFPTHEGEVKGEIDGLPALRFMLA